MTYPTKTDGSCSEGDETTLSVVSLVGIRKVCDQVLNDAPYPLLVFCSVQLLDELLHLQGAKLSLLIEPVREIPRDGELDGRCLVQIGFLWGFFGSHDDACLPFKLLKTIQQRRRVEEEKKKQERDFKVITLRALSIVLGFFIAFGRNK